MKLLKCLGVLVFCMVLGSFLALAGGSEWGTPSMGFALFGSVWSAGVILVIMKHEGTL